MKIAIVDDLSADRELLRTLLEMFFDKIGFTADIREFSSAEQFLSTLEPEIFDLCFMDIYMENLDGMAASQLLYSIDPDCMLIFLSSSDEFIADGYRVHALRYLLKPVTAAQLQDVLPECVEHAILSRRRLKVQIGRKEREIPFSRILYVISSHGTEIHLKKMYFPLSTRQTFSETTAPLLDDYRFISCGRGIVVNMAHAVRIDDGYFIMDNDERVPISRRCLSAVNDRFIDFQFEYLI